MPRIEITAKELIVHLTAAEKIFGLRGNLHIPATSIRGASALDKKFWLKLGVRAPGTGLPGVIVAGTYRWRGDKVYAFWTKGQQPLQITLDGKQYNRIIIGVENAQELADTINDAIVSC